MQDFDLKHTNFNTHTQKNMNVIQTLDDIVLVDKLTQYFCTTVIIILVTGFCLNSAIFLSYYDFLLH